jgi:hypothetical protein
MSNTYISKVDNFILDFSEIKPEKQLEILKSTISSSLDYFKSAYLIAEETNILDNKNLFDEGYKNIIKIGYEYIFKINCALDILCISDESQTNKFKYEEALMILYESSKFLNMFNELNQSIYLENIDQYINVAKILKNDKSEPENLVQLYRNKDIYFLNIKINIFNHYINQIVLQICKIKLILKNVHILYF